MARSVARASLLGVDAMRARARAEDGQTGWGLGLAQLDEAKAKKMPMGAVPASAQVPPMRFPSPHPSNSQTLP